MDTFVCAVIRAINDFAPGAVPLGDCSNRNDAVGPLFGIFLAVFGLLALFGG